MYEPIEENLIPNLSESDTPILEGQALLSVPFTVENKVDTVLKLLNSIVLLNDHLKQVTIHSLGDKNTQLRSPITINVCYQDGQCYAELLELNLLGVGIDEYEAINDFKLNLLELHSTLKSLSNDELGPEPVKWKILLSQYIQ